VDGGRGRARKLLGKYPLVKLTLCLQIEKAGQLSMDRNKELLSMSSVGYEDAEL
jgi:hypothetical protein